MISVYIFITESISKLDSIMKQNNAIKVIKQASFYRVPSIGRRVGTKKTNTL